MSTVREITETFLRLGTESRLEKLRAIGAPAVMVSSLEKALAGCLSDKVAKVTEYGSLAVRGHTSKRYRRNNGIEFETGRGKVWLVPGPHGWFLTDKPA